jgi:hypothetical protein
VPSTAEYSEQLIYAILSAQVSALRDRVGSGVTVELLWNVTDILTRLSNLVRELSEHRSDTEPDPRCTAALIDESAISQQLEEQAFRQAQHQDLLRQMADCVTTALGRLAQGDATVSSRLSPRDLAGLYVSEEQRAIHDAVIRAFSLEASRRTAGLGADSRDSEGFVK